MNYNWNWMVFWDPAPDGNGTYLDLLKYLEDVEGLPWRLAWTNVELKTLVYPQVQLRATLYTVSPSPTLFTF